MNTRFLFPYKLKKISGIIFFITLILCFLMLIDYSVFSKINPNLPVFAIAGDGIPVSGVNTGAGLLGTHYFSLIYNEILDEILFVVLVISGLIYAFSKEKSEDEMIMKIRLDSLAWATYFNYILLLICYLFFYGFPFLKIMVIAMFSNLLFFIIRFRWVVFNYNKEFDEE